MIDITMTATLRPEILNRTLKSFKKHLFRDFYAPLFINIDPVGPGKLIQMFDIFYQYFPPCSVNVNAPSKPGFGRAFKWLWNQPHAPWIFHLEDDWELLRAINPQEMINCLKANPDLALLRLPWKPTGLQSMKNWRYFFPWNGQFFECPKEFKREVGFCGHPSLIRREFVQNTIKYLDETRNPEKQFHHGPPELMAEIDKWRYGVFAKPNEPPAIRDIGREWMVKNSWRKAGNKAFFTQWEEINECRN